MKRARNRHNHHTVTARGSGRIERGIFFASAACGRRCAAPRTSTYRPCVYSLRRQSRTWSHDRNPGDGRTSRQPPQERVALGARGERPSEEYLDTLGREAIIEALEHTHYNRTAAASLLGITFRALRYRLERPGIEVGDAGSEGL